MLIQLKLPLLPPPLRCRSLFLYSRSLVGCHVGLIRLVIPLVIRQSVLIATCAHGFCVTSSSSWLLAKSAPMFRSNLWNSLELVRVKGSPPNEFISWYAEQIAYHSVGTLMETLRLRLTIFDGMADQRKFQ